jgi:hypothetical protein
MSTLSLIEISLLLFQQVLQQQQQVVEVALPDDDHPALPEWPPLLRGQWPVLLFRTMKP